MNNIRNITLSLALAALLTSCSESFPSILDDNVQSRPGEVLPSETEADLSSILPTLSAPQFNFITRAADTGQSQGAFNEWAVDKEKWTQADFRTFAFQTTNRLSGLAGGAADYSHTNDHQSEGRGGASDASSLCLLFNRILHVTDPQTGKVRFVDDADQEQTFYYRITNQDKKYNFFTFYADDAVANADRPGSYTRSLTPEGRQQLSCQVSINGYQDLMHAFAYHTREQYMDRVQQLMDSDMPKDQIKALSADNYDQLLYSSYAAHRNIQPSFQIKHLLSKFNIQVKGATMSHEVTPESDFHNIVITDIALEVPSRGTFYFARDEWGDPLTDKNASLGDTYLRQLKAGQLIDWDESSKEYLAARVKSQPLDNPLLYPQLEGWVSDQGKAWDATKPHFNVQSGEATQLAEAILLPPHQRSINIYLQGWFLNFNDKERTELNENMKLRHYDTFGTIQLPDESQTFEPGMEYTVTIYVYGYQHIQVEALFGSVWEKGNTGEGIIINKDGEDELQGDTDATINIQ